MELFIITESILVGKWFLFEYDGWIIRSLIIYRKNINFDISFQQYSVQNKQLFENRNTIGTKIQAKVIVYYYCYYSNSYNGCKIQIYE